MAASNRDGKADIAFRGSPFGRRPFSFLIGLKIPTLLLIIIIKIWLEIAGYRSIKLMYFLLSKLGTMHLLNYKKYNKIL